MRSIDVYYQNTKDALPHENVREFLTLNVNLGNAIELGSGAGRDTIYLIKNNWNVLSIDREDTKDLIIKRLDKNELKRFRFQKQDFEDIKLEKNDLLVANYSLPFCKKDRFYELWNKIVNSINKNRIFCRKFLWSK